MNDTLAGVVSDLLPSLRPTLQLAPSAPEETHAAVLVDPELGRRLRLDARGYQVAQLLDREQTLDELAERMGSEVAAVRKVIGLFQDLHLLDTDATRAFVDASKACDRWQSAHPSEVPLLIREDARFSCTMCGGCCGGHNIGPIQEDVLAGLADKMAALQQKTGSKKGLFARFPVQTGARIQEQVVCHSQGGSCVFLTDEQRCLIHQEYGGDAKPRVCRLFPYEFIATPTGVAVSVSPECRGFADARAGASLVDQEAELRELLGIIPTLRRVRPALMLDDTTAMPYEDYETLEDALHDAVDAHPDHAYEALLAMRAAIETRRDRSGSGNAAPRDVAELRAQLDALVGRIQGIIDEVCAAMRSESETVRIHTESLQRLAEALRTLRFDFARVTRPLRKASQRALFVEKIHHQLMGKELTMAPSLVKAMARLSFSWFVARALMVSRARAVKRVRLTAQDVTDAIAVTTAHFRNQALMQALRVCDDDLVTLFYEGLPALLAHAQELPDDDISLDVYKF